MAEPNILHEDNTLSTVSVYPFQKGEDISTSLKEIDGEIINTLSDQYYRPTDNEEWNSLHRQHTAFVLGLGGLYPAKDMVQAILAPEKGKNKSILDLGCGTGIWVVEMAKQFPWARVVGVDLAPCSIPPKELPVNCHFEIHDINSGLSKFESQFDMVHVRFVGTYLKDVPQRIKDINSCLKPGGIVVWIEGDTSMFFTEHFKYIPPTINSDFEASRVQRPFAELRRALMEIGSDVEGLETAIAAGFWSDQNIDPETCQTAELFLPVGPWATSDDTYTANQLALVGSLMRQNLLGGMESIKPILIRVGWPATTVNEWMRLATTEFETMKSKPAMRGKLAWGRRRANHGGPAPTLPNLPPMTRNFSNEATCMPKKYPPYPYFFVYDSQEVSQKQIAMRNSDITMELPSLPTQVV